jgi:hypothetical protein
VCIYLKEIKKLSENIKDETILNYLDNKLLNTYKKYLHHEISYEKFIAEVKAIVDFLKRKQTL